MIKRNSLIGTWSGGADDGSGLRTMMYNFGIIFNRNGSGKSFSWNNEGEEYEEKIVEIEWENLGKNKLRLRYLNEKVALEEWEIIEYEISDFIGAYDSKYLKLVNKGENVFWNFPEPMYQSKVITKNPILNFFKRILKK